MDDKNLSNAIASLAPGDGFSITGNVTTEEEYNSSVVFADPSAKPSWSNVQAKLPDEQWGVVRVERYIKLLASDWTQIDDVPITPEWKAEWQTYRQALRDITNQSDPFNITWPTPPE
tara:strand:- start:209 stop:559 length:351 start_codon:yes stop_codon:yes gene_type:complete